MAYNQTAEWVEAEESLERLAKQFVDFKSNLDKSFDKLTSLKADRGPTNQELADSFGPEETVPVLHVDEAEAALTAMKAVMDSTTGPQEASIVKYA